MLLARRFGPSAETVSEAELGLFNEAEMLAEGYVLMDETAVQVLKGPGKAPETKSYL